MDRFEAMRAFARVVETGSFTRAAHTLQISRTTVTQLVQQLEAHLRLRLLNRTTRRVSVTADGAAYYPRIARLLAELEEVEGGLGDAASQPRGRLRVDVPGPYARLRLVPALPDFQARYPDIQLDVGVSDREVDVIADNVDCVIRGGTPTDPALVARPLAALPIGFHASPGYVQRFGLPTYPRALEGPDHHMVGFLSPRSGRRGCSARSAAMNASRCRAAIRSASMTATPIWPQRWRAWAWWRCPATWPTRTWRVASCCRYWRTGNCRRCRCT